MSDFDRYMRLAGSVLQGTGPDLSSALLRRVAALVEQEVLNERTRCTDLCRRRVELWRNTTAAGSGVSASQEECRARSNEALYLAHLIGLGGEMAGRQSPELGG